MKFAVKRITNVIARQDVQADCCGSAAADYRIFSHFLQFDRLPRSLRSLAKTEILTSLRGRSVRLTRRTIEYLSSALQTD